MEIDLNKKYQTREGRDVSVDDNGQGIIITVNIKE